MIPKNHYVFYVFIVSLLAYIIPVVYKYFIININISDVLFSLNKLENSYKPKPSKNLGPLVLVGFGGCADISVPAIDLLKSLNLTAPSPKSLKSDWNEDGILNSMEAVNLEFTHMFSEGAASERYVANKEVFDRMLAVANARLTSDANSKWSLGGNAAVMASRIAKEGGRVSLAARLSDRQKQALPKELRVLQAPAQFGLSAGEPVEDIHLILEYSAGDQWGNYTSPRANRLILIRDEENPRISGMWDGLMSSWSNADWSNAHSSVIGPPNLFVLGGLQTMANWYAADTPDFRWRRLEKLEHLLAHGLHRDTLVHFEMASFAEETLSRNITRMLLPHVDSIGLNEQELPNLVSLLSEGRVQTEAALSTPRVAVMLDQMREVWSTLTSPTLPWNNNQRRRLSRIHLHTLGYQIIMVRRDPTHLTHELRQRFEEEHRDGRLSHLPLSDLGRAWPFVKAAAAKASLTAHRYTCASASIDPVLTHMLMDESFAVTTDPQRWPFAGGDLSFKDPSASPPGSANRRTRVQFNSTEPVRCWYEQEPGDSNKENTPGVVHTVRFCVSPGLVCQKVQKTAGAGDNISAAALAIQTTGKEDA